MWLFVSAFSLRVVDVTAAGGAGENDDGIGVSSSPFPPFSP